MNKKAATIILLALMAGLVYAFYAALAKHPVAFFVLKATPAGVAAYKLDVMLAPVAPKVSTLFLSPSQMRSGVGILEQKSIPRLREFASQFGKWKAVIGVPSKEVSWPASLGGGWGVVFRGASTGEFDDLNFGDKLYLALRVKAPGPVSASAEIPLDLSALPAAEATPSRPVSTVSPEGTLSAPLRVEILNGCGIKRAADWVALRIKGPRLVVTGTGNADNYRYSSTMVRTSGGVSPALAEVMDRLGIPRESAVLDDSLDGSIDARIIIGKDFLKIKEKLRGRKPHRAQ